MVTNQALLFAIFIFNGIIIGLLFDFFRILRKSFKTKDIITYIEDILFWILTGLILLYSIFTFNNGEIRFYMFLAAMLGCIFYMLLFSNFVIKINLTFINLIKGIAKKVFNIVIFPLRIIVTFLKKICRRPIAFIIINIKKFSNNFLTNIKRRFSNNKTKRHSES